MALEDAGIVGIPIVRVENACSSGSSALREAILAVQAGAAGVVLVLGLEVMSAVDTKVAIQALNGAGDLEREGALGMTFPAHFAMMAQAHEHEFGTTREQVAGVAVKNHAHAALNDKAQFRRPITSRTSWRHRPSPIRSPFSTAVRSVTALSGDRRHTGTTRTWGRACPGLRTGVGSLRRRPSADAVRNGTMEAAGAAYEHAAHRARQDRCVGASTTASPSRRWSTPRTSGMREGRWGTVHRVRRATALGGLHP